LLHDFDKSGFSIAGTLQRDTRRHRFAQSFAVHDLGLRLKDVDGLEAEQVTHNASDTAVAANLKENGATDEEIEFLLSERVELNAFTSDELVQFIKRRLADIGIEKVIPDEQTLKQACTRARAKALINEQIEAIVEKASEDAAQMTEVSDLAARVHALLKDDRALSWDAAIARIVEEADEGE
jgi:hypothetical protein